MTFEQLLVKYIYQHKKVSLQGFGAIVLNASVPENEIIHKNRQIPIEGLSFDFDLKATTDENFILFFAQQRGKIKPLAVSDIESHLQLAKQLMNIGKPYEVDGLGIFSMQKDGSMVLTPANYAVPSGDNLPQPGRLKERTEAQEKSESEQASRGLSAGAKKSLMGVAIVLLLAVIGWFIWSQYGKPTTETNAIEPPVTDSTGIARDTLATTSTITNTANASDSTAVQQWKAYFRTFSDKGQALERLKFYENLNNPVQLETTDSVNFRMYVLVQSSVADTARKIDSLKKFYARTVTLEKLHP